MQCQRCNWIHCFFVVEKGNETGCRGGEDESRSIGETQAEWILNQGRSFGLLKWDRYRSGRYRPDRRRPVHQRESDSSIIIGCG